MEINLQGGLVIVIFERATISQQERVAGGNLARRSATSCLRLIIFTMDGSILTVKVTVTVRMMGTSEVGVVHEDDSEPYELACRNHASSHFQIPTILPVLDFR